MAHSAGSDPDDIPIEWIRWRPIGQLGRDEVGDLVFPPVSAEPGIYRFLIRDDTEVFAGYIGQAAKSLAKRFSLYRTRGRRPSYPLEKKTTSRNALRLIAELQAGHTVAVAVVDDRVTRPDGRDLVLDLANTKFRSSLERQLILAMRDRNRGLEPERQSHLGKRAVVFVLPRRRSSSKLVSAHTLIPEVLFCRRPGGPKQSSRSPGTSPAPWKIC
jgi:hypothetical protein